MKTVNSKTCINCRLEKELNLFHKASRNLDGRNSYCKKCMSEYAKLNKESVTKSKKSYYERERLKTAEAREAKEKKRILESPLKKETQRKKRLEQQKIRNLLNPEIKKKCDKSYREKTKSQRNAKERARKAVDPQYRLTVNLRTRLYYAIKNNQKIGSAIKDLGCSVGFLKSYLESLFQPGMTWNNYGKGIGTWQVDHIKALCLFKLTNKEEFLKANNYTNLQPMWYEDHLNKTINDIAKNKAE